MLKRIAYILLIISYFIVGFILIYVNRLSDNDNTNKLITGFGIIILVSMWLKAFFLLSKDDVGHKEDKLTTILKVIVHLPLYLILFPICIVPALIQIIPDSFKNKVKPLLKNGFKLTEEKVEKKKIYYLSKENIVLKIREFDLYEISEDFGKISVFLINSDYFL
jgi:cytochrome b561